MLLLLLKKKQEKNAHFTMIIPPETVRVRGPIHCTFHFFTWKICIASEIFIAQQVLKCVHFIIWPYPRLAAASDGRGAVRNGFSAISLNWKIRSFLLINQCPCCFIIILFSFLPVFFPHFGFLLPTHLKMVFDEPNGKST